MDNRGYDSEKGHHVHVAEASELDIAAQLTVGKCDALSSEEAARIRRKIDWNVLPLMCIMYLMAFADKTTLGQSAVLGILRSADLTQNQFNWLGTVFYLSYLLFLYPQSLALQRFPVGKWMSINIFIWAIALLAHSACKSFGSLLVVRFILGACEGAITPGFMIVTSMFYTRDEQINRVGYWFLMNGFAIIFLGFVSFGLLHTNAHNFAPWQWLMIITGSITFMTSIIFWFFFPDSPATARFLTPTERVLAAQRIKVNQTGIENKTFKKEQFIEALTDPKAWLLALFAAIANVPNSLTNQRQLILRQFGFSPFKTTLLGSVDGVVEIVTILAAVIIATHWRFGRGYAAVLMFVPAIVGDVLVNALPSHNRVGLLFSYWVSLTGFAPFVIVLGWAGSITAGHTKRITTNAMLLCAYAIGNACGAVYVGKTTPTTVSRPEAHSFSPSIRKRNHTPWTVIGWCCAACVVVPVALRLLLEAENKRRDNEERNDTYAYVIIKQIGPDGKEVEGRVDKAFLDLTDRQNRDFRYIL